VRVDVRGDTTSVEKDIDRGLSKVGRDLDDDFEDLGHRWGKETSRGMGSEIEKSAPEFSRALERATAGMREAKLPWALDRDRNVIRRGVSKLADEIEDEVRTLSSGGGGGPFGKVGQAISDAIGAGFNISGRSPLILFLVPLIGLIGELIVGAIQGVQGLVALLTIVPSLIGAIGLQVGVLFLAFHGLGEAIGNAFSAKNPQEFQKAIEGLTPAAQEFVRTLVPLKEVFVALSKVAQEGFFGSFGNSLRVLQKGLAQWAPGTIRSISEALGGLARVVVTFFNDPAFLRFIEGLGPSIVRWIQDFEPALEKLLVGLANLGTAVQPFLDWFGKGINAALGKFGDYLNNLAADPAFQQWLNDMKDTLRALGDALAGISKFIVSLVKAIDEAGGDKALKEIAAQFTILAGVLTSEVGIKGLEGIINAVIYLSDILVGLVIIVLFLSASLQSFFTWLIDTAFPAVGHFFSDTIPEALEAIGRGFVGFFKNLGELGFNIQESIGNAFTMLKENAIAFFTSIGGAIGSFISDWIGRIGSFFSGLGANIREAVGNVDDVLLQAGRNLIAGLIRGVRSMFPNIGGAMSEVAGIIAKYIPHSPAEEGPLSGKGDPFYSGQTIVERLSAGMTMEAPSLAAASSDAVSNITFGANSVQVGFYGQVPTQQQALATGNAVGQGIAGVLAARNTRLAVRTL
jgi:hypothetical protein